MPTLVRFIDEQYKSLCETHLQYPEKKMSKLNKFVGFSQGPLDEINPYVVEKWRSSCLKNGQAAAIVNRSVVLRSVLSKAVQWCVLEQHLLRNLKQLKVDRSPQYPLPIGG